jgi:hypothetical protein
MTMAQTHGRTRRQSFLRDIKTAVTGRIRSKPSAAGQQYLDLYTLKRDRARWDQLRERAEQMIRAIDKSLGKIEPSANANKDEARDAARVGTTINMKASSRRNAST